MEKKKLVEKTLPQNPTPAKLKASNKNPNQGRKKGSQFNCPYLSTTLTTSDHSSFLKCFNGGRGRGVDMVRTEQQESQTAKEPGFPWEEQWFLIWQLPGADPDAWALGLQLQLKLLFGG